MDEKDEDKSEESKKNHIAYYKSLTKVISDIQKESSLGTDPTIKNHLNHNKHLDLLQDYKTHLVKYIQELEKLDKQSEFAKKWNETTIKERKEELQVIDKILKNLIRF
jgi:hypothetical protein